jgi:LCP family protein required for cell wall assembly
MAGVFRVAAGIASASVLTLSLASAYVAHTADTLIDNIATAPRQVGNSTPQPSAPVEISRRNRYTNQPITILIAGSDTRQNSGNMYGNQNIHQGERADATILLHIPADRSRATAVSIPRDTWVTLPECDVKDGIGLTSIEGRQAKFNAAFDLSGIGCTVKLVENMTGLPIDHFAVVDFEGFKGAVDAIGGVDMCIPVDISDPDSGLVLSRGWHTLNGEQALGFVRARKTLADGSDISRINRQHDFLKAFMKKATSMRVLTNPGTIYSVLDVTTRGLTVDEELASKEALFDLALVLSEVPLARISFITVPWVPRGDGQNVVVDEVKAAELWRNLSEPEPVPLKEKLSSPSTSKKTPERAVPETAC